MLLHALPSFAEVPVTGEQQVCCASDAKSSEAPSEESEQPCKSACPATCCHPAFVSHPALLGMAMIESLDGAVAATDGALLYTSIDPPLQPPRA